MRLGSIISETLRNIASGTAHALAMFLAVLFAGTLLGGYEAMSVMRLETEAAVRIRAFADVKPWSAAMSTDSPATGSPTMATRRSFPGRCGPARRSCRWQRKASNCHHMR